jgi:hypothetical protein
MDQRLTALNVSNTRDFVSPRPGSSRLAVPRAATNEQQIRGMIGSVGRSTTDGRRRLVPVRSSWARRVSGVQVGMFSGCGPGLGLRRIALAVPHELNARSAWWVIRIAGSV